MEKEKKKPLDWHLGDIEQKFGFRGGKYTDVNIFLALFLAAILSGLVFLVLCNLPGGYGEMKVFAIILDRGWTPYAIVSLFLLGMSIIFLKWRKLSFQMRAAKYELVPAGKNFSLTPETAMDVLKSLNSIVDDPKRFVLFNRIERALMNLRNVGNVSDVSEMLRSQAENDEGHLDSSYGILSGIAWALPILGFIGTVTGLSDAIGGFGLVLSSESDAASLRESLSPVTGGLGIAFDTTLLALVLAMALQMVVTFLRKEEESFLDQCRDYAHVNVISRLCIAKENETR